MNAQNILFEKKDHIAVVTMNRPPANSWNMGAMVEFEKILDDVEQDKSIRVIVLTGAGEKCFSAGMDVKDPPRSENRSIGQDLWRRVERFPKPIISAINGHALGGGLELAMACHFRIMADSPNIQIGLTELNLGLIPGWGGTQRMVRLLGKAKALELILLSKRLSAQEALSLGLVNRITPPEKLMADTLDFAGWLAERPPLAVSSVLKSISAGIYEGMDAGLAMEVECSKMLAKSKDVIEGFTAFMEKRKPVFTGE
ncbi:MAG: enoyl-CoA hydratase-related protein [Desulfobacterales bacterium]|nr:enoyl-CoA hydratase-related protein [Desulfobacterales bacterium]